MTDAFAALEQRIQTALETYANVHRGSGHHSAAATQLYEQARQIVLSHLKLRNDKYTVLFCSPLRAQALTAQLKSDQYQLLSSLDLGLALGVRALAVQREALRGVAHFQTGGGTARLVSRKKVIWAKTPDKFEAGTPPIINIIAFAEALLLTGRYGNNAFHPAGGGNAADKLTTDDILFSDRFQHDTGSVLLEILRETRIGRGAQVHTASGVGTHINLDNAASTPTLEPIWETVRKTWRSPAALHREIVQETKSIIADFVGAPQSEYDILFTANTTEAVNLVAESLAAVAASEPDTETVVLNTLLEHTSNDLPWYTLPGASLIRLPVDLDGFIDLDEMERVFSAQNENALTGKKRIRLAAVSGASNVLGTFNDLSSISRIVHRHRAALLVDGAQLIAHRKIDTEALGIDYLVFSAHKAYAPFGTGVLVARKGLLRFSAAALEQIRRSGEENATGIAALGKALGLLKRVGLDVIQAEEQRLTERALRGLVQIDGLTVYGMKDPGAPKFAHKGGVIPFGIKGLMADRVTERLAAEGIGARHGCHCAHLIVKHLLGIGPFEETIQNLILPLLPSILPPGVARISFGIENTEQDVDRVIDVLRDIAQKPRARIKMKRQLNDFALAAAARVYGEA